MQIMHGTKSEIAVTLWQERLETYVKRINLDMECFRRFHDKTSVELMQEDCKALADIAKRTASVLDYIATHGIA